MPELAPEYLMCKASRSVLLRKFKSCRASCSAVVGAHSDNVNLVIAEHIPYDDEEQVDSADDDILKNKSRGGRKRIKKN